MPNNKLGYLINQCGSAGKLIAIRSPPARMMERSALRPKLLRLTIKYPNTDNTISAPRCGLNVVSTVPSTVNATCSFGRAYMSIDTPSNTGKTNCPTVNEPITGRKISPSGKAIRRKRPDQPSVRNQMDKNNKIKLISIQKVAAASIENQPR